MRHAIIAFAALVALPFLPARAADPPAMQLRGFQVEYGAVGAAAVGRMRASLDRQFDIVEDAKLPPAVLEFFRTVPVVIVPTLNTGFGRARQDEAGRQVVELKAADLPRDRPILLHELLHAYHAVKLGRTPAILNAYQQAKQSGIYPESQANAHFLDNPREYFAVIGSIYLYGAKIDQPPYDCGITAQAQPEFIAFLAQHFGERECR